MTNRTFIRSHGHDPRGVDGDRRWNAEPPEVELITYTVTLTPAELATLRDAVEAEVEHAHDAARDAGDDAAEVARYRELEDRNLTLWTKLGAIRPDRPSTRGAER